MDRMFTPWRLPYLQSMTGKEGCLFCRVVDETRDDENLILHRGAASFVIINLYPYSSGHLMVVPRRHLGHLSDATSEERAELMESVARCESVLREAYEPHGMNIGLNLGRSAGAGVVGHLHVHLVPRWEGDNNFASVIGNTRIVPETPPQTYQRLTPLFSGPSGAGEKSS
jgi:ATP adenylyltransferase